jgi:hypothetical protein
MKCKMRLRELQATEQGFAASLEKEDKPSVWEYLENRKSGFVDHISPGCRAELHKPIKYLLHQGKQ